MSIPRMVTPKVLIESKTPQIFSRGLCRLRITMDLFRRNLLTVHHRSNTLAASNAKGGKAQFAAVIFHRMKQGHQDTSAAGPNRMPQGNRTPSNVDLLRTQLQLIQHRERLCCERFIQLKKLNIREPETRLFYGFFHGSHRSDSHDRRIDT